eukprot:TRINITY_DN5201_c0_g1_i1.p3 TRINITY_DN5201_c0_g1~~TRINITY_DN5201_c0_g1_i1.p3  ORF type:complete len:84 (+),score=23.60 TRINITY_DN5201_c0_g1_i1:461-712(+)
MPERLDEETVDPDEETVPTTLTDDEESVSDVSIFLSSSKFDVNDALSIELGGFFAETEKPSWRPGRAFFDWSARVRNPLFERE